jgi:hypothetical protein
MRIIKVISPIFLIFCLFLIFSFSQAFAGPSSSTYELQEYGFGAGGVASSSSQNYLFQGTVGEVETASLSSQNYLALPGLTYTFEPNTPDAPTFTNPSNYYNKLHLIINNANNSSDTTFSIQVSSGSADFSNNTFYVGSDHTLGNNQTWQDYTSWGGTSGFDLIGLTPGTTYYARVAANKGTFQQGIFGPSANASTIIPTLTFSIRTTSQASPPYSISLALTPGNVITSTDTVDSTISTNASNGGLIYLYGTNLGLKSSIAGNYKINSTSNDLSSLQEGYGAQGTTTTQTSGGPMELISPYNSSGGNVGIVNTTKLPFADSSGSPVTNGLAKFDIKAKASNTTPAATDYSDVITLIGTASF